MNVNFLEQMFLVFNLFFRTNSSVKKYNLEKAIIATSSSDTAGNLGDRTYEYEEIIILVLPVFSVTNLVKILI